MAGFDEWVFYDLAPERCDLRFVARRDNLPLYFGNNETRVGLRSEYMADVLKHEQISEVQKLQPVGYDRQLENAFHRAELVRIALRLLLERRVVLKVEGIADFGVSWIHFLVFLYL